MESGGRPSLGQFILLGSSSVVTAMLYSVYRQKARVARELKGAKKMHLGEDLKSILSEAPGKCVPYAVIEGTVRSVKEMLNSQFVENCKGVIQRLTLQEHKMVWNRTTHLWNDYSKIIHQRTNTVPFDLVPHEDGVAVAVRVLKPLDSVDLGLETVYEKFHPSVQCFTDVIGHYISGERPKGIQETEEMLKVGATLTGVGELVLDNNSVRLQPPKQGMQYYLSSQDFDSLLQKQESSVRLWKGLVLVFGFTACATLFFILRKQYVQRQERLRQQRLQEEFRQHEAQLLSQASPEDRESLKSACVVCLSSFKSCVFLECGHVCSCRECYLALPEPKRCPICRQEITRPPSSLCFSPRRLGFFPPSCGFPPPCPPSLAPPPARLAAPQSASPTPRLRPTARGRRRTGPRSPGCASSAPRPPGSLGHPPPSRVAAPPRPARPRPAPERADDVSPARRRRSSSHSRAEPERSAAQLRALVGSLARAARSCREPRPPASSPARRRRSPEGCPRPATPGPSAADPVRRGRGRGRRRCRLGAPGRDHVGGAALRGREAEPLRRRRRRGPDLLVPPAGHQQLLRRRAEQAAAQAGPDRPEQAGCY